MSTPPHVGVYGDAARWGLCASCVHHRVVESGKGSRFVLCGLSRTDPSFPRYPRVPVVRCAGYERSPAPDPQRER